MGRISVGTSGWSGLHPRDFARRYDMVEFNWTFHERDHDADHYQKVAAELKDLHLLAVLKVSGIATHENRLRSPDQWWPGLWSKYSELLKAGVLGGLLWQLAPSHRCSRQSLAELEQLARMLPRDVLHIFEFRHSSWYEAYKDDVLNFMRRWQFCMAWINIKNEDGWCGDLEDGWPSLSRTCPSVYLRLFGTKQKAIGRYGEEVIREEILPLVQGPGCPEESYVVFAQADVPDHAKADASFMIELLGRVAPQPGRSARWERDVLVATLGLGVGMKVDGTVQRLSHRTVFVDIGRACRAFLDANHARRAGLLENLCIGTRLEGLEIQHLEFQGEWGIVGLSCHDATIGVGALDPERTTACTGPASAEKRSRWLKGSGGPEHDAAAAPPPDTVRSAAATAVAEMLQEEAQAGILHRRQRWSQRGDFNGLAEIGGTSGSRCVRSLPPEEVEERARAKRLADRVKRDERVSRWARALVEKAFMRQRGQSQAGPKAKPNCRSSGKSSGPARGAAKRSRSEGPAARTRRENATISSAEVRKAAHRQVELQELLLPDSQRSRAQKPGQVLPGEPCNGPMVCSTDEFLLMQLEVREAREGMSDKNNTETFGHDHNPQGWDVEQMFEANENLRRTWRSASLRCSEIDSSDGFFPYEEKTYARNKMPSSLGSQQQGGLGDIISRFPNPLQSDSSVHNDEDEWQVLTPSAADLEELWEDQEEIQAESEEGTREVVTGEEEVPEEEGEEDPAACLEGNDDFQEGEAAQELEAATHEASLAPRGETWQWVPARAKANSWADISEQEYDPKGSLADISEIAESPQDCQPAREGAEEGMAATEANSSHKGRSWRGRRSKSLEAAAPEKDPETAASGEEESDAGAARAAQEEEHEVRCSRCGAAYLLNVDISALGEDFCCELLGRECGTSDMEMIQEEKLEEEKEEDTEEEKDEDEAKKTEEEEEEEEEEEVAYAVVCDICGETHIAQVDFMGLGLDFNCAMVGARCAGSSEADPAAAASSSSRSAVPVLPPRAQLQQLSAEEKKDLFNRFALQRQQESVSRKELYKNLRQLADRKGQLQRYRDNQVVTHKGERFIKINVSLDPGPGCELGGILGWRSKAGRRGLGIKKMTKEEADRVCLSNKNRAHTRKATGPGGYKDGFQFENKWSKHTSGSLQGKAGGSLRK